MISDRSKDRDSDRKSHPRDQDERKRGSDASKDRHRFKDPRDRSDSHGSKQSRQHDSNSPDRKKSRYGDFKEDESWSSRRDRDRKLEQEEMEGKIPSSGSGAKKATSSRMQQKKNKPGEWIIDTQGDQDVFRYGGINPLTVPRYTRVGGGRVLGMSNHMRIDYEKSRAIGNREIVMTTGGRRSKSVRYIDPHATWRDRSHEYKRLTRAKAQEIALSLHLDREDPTFIPLDMRVGSRKATPESDIEDQDEDEDEDYDFEGKKKLDYRDIHGMSVYKEEDEDLLQTTSDQEEVGAESALEVLMRRRTMLDDQLRQDPKQPETWLEFIAVEDEIDFVTSRRSAAAVTAHSTGHVEIKLSIFERALESNPLDQHLLLEYMNTCRLCWEPAKVLTKWDELLQSNKLLTAWPGIWIEYLNYRQRHFLSFTVKSFIDVLQEALDRLGHLAISTWQAMQRSAENNELRAQLVKIECVMVHVIVRTWTFLKQAGYIERAQGTLQGQVEFLFNMPSSLVSESWRVQIGSLGEFWDSELPRFGEKDAKGWSHYVTEEDEVTMESQLERTKLPAPDAPNEELLKAFADDDMDRYQYSRWAKLEKDLNNLCWFPIRTTEDLPDQLEDDPYGIVLFEDIKPFVVSLYSTEARLQFVDCMLTFLGLPVNSFAGSNGLHSASKSSAFNNPTKVATVYNPYLHDGLLLNLGMDFHLTLGDNPGLNRFFPKNESEQDLIERVLREIEREQELREPEERDWSCVWKFPLRLFPHGSDTIFGHIAMTLSGEKGVRNPYPWAIVSSHEEIEHSHKQLVRDAIQQLMEVVPLPKTHRRNLSIYHLMYETMDTLSASKSQKLAKKYLKADRMDLALWNSYAQAEKALGRISEARKVYSTALSMYLTFPAENQARAPLIYRHYAELEWEQGRRGVALAILMALAEGSSANVPENESEDVSIPTPTRLIKSRQFYSQRVAQLNLGRPSSALLSSGPLADSTRIGGKWFEPALDWIVCFAWFEYLSTPTESGVSAGVKVFEDAIQEMDFRNPDSEIDVPVQDSQSSLQQQKFRTPLFPSLSLTMDVFKAETRTAKKKVSTGPEAEMLWIQLAKLVYFHSLLAKTPFSRSENQEESSRGRGSGRGGGFQPRDLRRVVQRGLERFPNCSILQSLFFWTEAQQRLHGRVRTWVHEQVRQGHGRRQVGGGGMGGGIVASKEPLWMFGLFYELWHQEPYNADVVRSLLESALESSRSSSFTSSPTLWMVYLEMEVRESGRRSRGEDKSKSKKPSLMKAITSSDGDGTDLGVGSGKRVKQLLMRAIDDCPWCKGLYMIAFEPRMRQLFSIEELDQLYQTMLEKGIRVRSDLPERVASSEVQSAWESNKSVDDDREDDISSSVY
ncbi:hypothetical protein BGX28_000378 [Mortierella sp. GBA30]|nr:hypothetical protein BGX28_000378 [Mortierella sp. GBA30]